MKKYVDKDGLAYFAQEFYDKTKDVFATKAQVGSPLVAATVAGMTDTDKIYVYTGSETGYTAGDWYYYDGSDWVSGGVYNSVAVQTDTSLSVAGMAADAKTVGDDLDALDGRLDTIEGDYVTESEMTAAISANVDATLSVSGKAADAKAAGDAILDLEGRVFPAIRYANDFVNGSRYLTNGFADVSYYARSNYAYPPGKYVVDAINPGWIAVGYISDTQGSTIVGNWTASKTTFTASIPFYITFNAVLTEDVFNNIQNNFTINRILNESGNTLAEAVDDLSDTVDVLEDKVDNIPDENVITESIPQNVFNGVWHLDETIRQSDGSFVPRENYARTDHIPVKAGNVYIGIKYTGTSPQVVVNYCVYNSRKEKVAFGNGNALQITVIDDMQYSVITVDADGYIALDIYKQNHTYEYYVSNTLPTSYVDYYVPVKMYRTDLFEQSIVGSMTFGRIPSQAIKNSFSDGDTIIVESNSIKKNYMIMFYAKVSAFNTIFIGHGKEAYGYYVKIDNTNMTYMSNGTEGTAIAHDLTIEDYICVIISVDAVLNAKITIITKTGQFSRTQGGWTGTRGNIFVENYQSTLSDAVLTWNSDDYKKAVWAFGDSYFATNTNIRWPYWVVASWGFDNMLLNAYPGEASESAYTDFETALQHGTPRYLLWCLGMNDPDSSSAVNSNWLSVIEKIEELCQRYEIELILATIPNVTNESYNNTLKNQYVIESGYRYIDFASAVNGVSGWLSDDGVHPSEVGARLLAVKAITDVPEIIQGK